jgi:group II intron reverse transcriptase/maturase
LEGKMAGRSGPKTVSTKLQQIAKLAREAPDMVLDTLAHHIDVEWLREAYRRTRKSGAVGVDGQSAAAYAENLEENLRSLLERFKSGTYRAPPVRRAYVPKDDGKKSRGIGVPTFEDKVLQRAVVMVLEAVYEQDFLECSYGCRPGRSAHQALGVVRQGLRSMGGGWVLDVDVQQFFDMLEHNHLRRFLDQRVRDGVLRRAIDKWLKAGVFEDGSVQHPDMGTPQGGVVSPVLANIYLHYVVDLWFEKVVKPRLLGRAFLNRYMDDMVFVFSVEKDAHRVKAVLSKRLGKYGLRLHPEKTRLVMFRPPCERLGRNQRPGSFDFLGFTHHWGRSLKGAWVIKRRTAKDRFRRALKKISQWCRRNRHRPLAEQQHILGQKLRGHYHYYGITGNGSAIPRFFRTVVHVWRKWLSRRSQRARLNWEKFNRLLKRYPLPPPVVVHSKFRRVANP